MFFAGGACDFQDSPGAVGVYVTSNPVSADYRLYISSVNPDAVIFVTDDKHESDTFGGVWFFTDDKHFSEIIVYFSDTRYESDLTIEYTEYKTLARWH